MGQRTSSQIEIRKPAEKAGYLHFDESRAEPQTPDFDG